MAAAAIRHMLRTSLTLFFGRRMRGAFQSIRDTVTAKVGLEHFNGVNVQPFAKLDGYEVILGSSIDPQFGPARTLQIAGGFNHVADRLDGVQVAAGFNWATGPARALQIGDAIAAALAKCAQVNPDLARPPRLYHASTSEIFGRPAQAPQDEARRPERRRPTHEQQRARHGARPAVPARAGVAAGRCARPRPGGAGCRARRWPDRPVPRR